jgi:hypothetical protein
MKVFKSFASAKTSWTCGPNPAIFIQAAKHLQRERNGGGACKCHACETVRAVLRPLDYSNQSPRGTLRKYLWDKVPQDAVAPQHPKQWPPLASTTAI